MKIGPKLALCFVALAVIPVGLAMLFFGRATTDLGHDIADAAQTSFAARLTEDLQRATDLNALAFDSVRDQLMQDAVNAAAEIAARFDAAAQEPTPETVTPRMFRGGDNGAGPVDLSDGDVRFEADVARDAVAGTLARLDGLADVGRTMYLRHRDVLSGMAVVLDMGLTIRYPLGSFIEPVDLRETDWYAETLVTGAAGWHAPGTDDFRRVMAVAPVARASGQLLGTVRFNLPLEQLLNATIGPAQLPAAARSALIVVPRDHPNLYPHRIARFDIPEGRWIADPSPDPLSVDGDDRWLKVVSDIRTGVPGLEAVVRDGEAEVWSFTPLGPFAGGDLHLATVLPASVVEAAQRSAEELVATAFRSQLGIAGSFTIGVGLIAGLLAAWLAGTFTRPIRRLHDAARQLASGDFSVRIDVKGGDEIADLSRDFNDLAPALEKQLETSRALGIAQEVQQNLLPKAVPPWSGFDIAGHAVYCDETGGDYLDYVPLGDGRSLAVVLGDVSGHGVGSALLMASARATLRALARRDDAFAALIDDLNHDLAADVSAGRFMTMFAVMLPSRSGEVQWISAGHEPVLVYAPETDTFSELAGDDIPLAVDRSWTYEAASLNLTGGTLLIAVTDGVREAVNAAGERYETERLKEAVRAVANRGSDAIATHILDDVAAFRGDAKMLDDVSVVVIRRTA